MCYSAALAAKRKRLEEHYGVQGKLPLNVTDDDMYRHHINGFGKQYFNDGKMVSVHPLMYVIPQENPKFITPLMWGFIPEWELGEEAEDYYNNSREFGSGLNARSEKLFTSRMYMDSADYKRCIVPVTGFHEPHTAKKNGRDFKVPFYFKARDKEFTNLAGIYSITKDGHATFAVLTKPGTPLFLKTHNTKKRRPVILHDHQIEGWLDSSLEREDLEEIIANDLPDEDIKAYPISKDLYSQKTDSNRENIVNQVDYQEIAIDYEGKPQHDFTS